MNGFRYRSLFNYSSWGRYSFYCCFCCIFISFPSLASSLPNSYDVRSTTGSLVKIYPHTVQAANDGRLTAVVDSARGTVTRRARVPISVAIEPLFKKLAVLRTPYKWVGALLLASEIKDSALVWINPDTTVSAIPNSDDSMLAFPPTTGATGWQPLTDTVTGKHPDTGATITVYGNTPSYYRYSTNVKIYISESHRLAFNSFMANYPSAPQFNPSATSFWVYVDGVLTYEPRYTATLQRSNFLPLDGYGVDKDDAWLVARLPSLNSASEARPLTQTEAETLLNKVTRSLGADVVKAPIIDGVFYPDFYNVADPFTSPSSEVIEDVDTPPQTPEEPFDPEILNIKIPVQNIDFSNAISTGSRWLPRTCPEPVLLGNVLGEDLYADVSVICPVVVDYLGPVNLFVGWLAAFMIIFRGIKR